MAIRALLIRILAVSKNMDPAKKYRFDKFWLIASLLVIIAIVPTFYYGISRPFYGLHSWKAAASAWRARCYLKYDLSYTKGLAVWEVGDPPSEKPNLSLDHPQLGLFMPALDLAVFGVNERGARIGGLIRVFLSLLIFLRLLRGLVDDKTALVAGLLFAIFPVTGYFGVRGWVTVVSLLATWYYLVIIGSLTNAPKPKGYHKWLLAVLLFLALQLSWEGFFYAFAIGLHYVFRCLRRKEFPNKLLLMILLIAPLSSLVLDFAVLAAGHSWNWQSVWELYRWRAAKGEMPEFLWGPWFARMWEFAILNFTLPVLIVVIVYLTFGQLIIFTTEKDGTSQRFPRQFPQFWLFLMPAVFQLFILKGALWKHQYWESPLAPFIAIAAALAVMLLFDILKKVNRQLAVTGVVLLVGIMAAFCITGVNYYYSVRWQPAEKIQLFKELNKKIPPDKALLSFEDFQVNQNPVKGPHYRPEIAWYLDRKIVQAGVINNRRILVTESIQDIEAKAATGRYPYYLIPAAKPLVPIINSLAKKYKYEVIKGVPGRQTKDGKFLKAGMMSYIIFDLNNVRGK